ncbi:mucolipin-3-like isoform X2 [Dysidea avara]|uniref:mucolipin-3-like isoform X2 n=1 Tax=Dysidea avara TaxID=196820 RepID=UPI003327355E
MKHCKAHDNEVEDEKRSCSSRIGWMCTKLFQFTFGACCYGPIVACLSLCRMYNGARKLSGAEEELTSYVQYVQPSSERNSAKDDQQWKRRTQILKADTKVKQRLKYQFQDHIQKWMDIKHRRFPWKATLHVLLVILVTIQVSFYAGDKFKLTNFLIDHSQAFQTYFVRKEFDQTVTTLYTVDDIYKQIEHTVYSYYNVTKQAVSALEYMYSDDDTVPVLKMNITYRGQSKCGISGSRSSAFPSEISNDSVHWSINLYLPTVAVPNNEICDHITTNCCSEDYCNHTIISQVEHYINRKNLDRISKILLIFNFTTHYREDVVETETPVSAKFYVTVCLDNDMHGSSMSVEAKLGKDPELRRYCIHFRLRNTIVDICVMVLVILSSLTYITSILKTIKLSKDIKLHFLAYHEKHLRWKEITPLYNKWYMLMLFTDLLIMVATALKIVSEYQQYISITIVEVICILLGVGVFLLWCGMFGILCYFESLNVLLITIQLAFPSILRFALCISILFIAFALCGWLVLGPYHPKFNGFLVTAESLFCILNGDDLYGTFEGIEVRFILSNTVRIFSKFYLCVFIFLFIYVVLSLFIGIFNHAYESLSDNWRQRSRGFLRDWAEGEPDDDPTHSYPFPVPPIRQPIDNSSSSSSSSSTDSNSDYEDEIQNTSTYSNLSPCVPNNIYLSLDPQTSNMNAGQGYQGLLRKRSGSRAASTRARYSTIKSIIAEPPCANKEEIAKARFKLKPSNTSSSRLNMEESDV